MEALRWGCWRKGTRKGAIVDPLHEKGSNVSRLARLANRGGMLYGGDWRRQKKLNLRCQGIAPPLLLALCFVGCRMVVTFICSILHTIPIRMRIDQKLLMLSSKWHLG